MLTNMKFVIKSFPTILLGVVATAFLTLALYYSGNSVYGFSKSTQDGKTAYWDPADGPCSEKLRETKRPVKTVNAISLFYFTTILGSGGTSKFLDNLEEWKSQQGNCPYQVMDIYKSGVPIDLYIATLGFGALSLVLLKKSKTHTF